MEKSAHLAALTADSAAMAAAARIGLDRIVPACPDWTGADLIAHTGRVHRAVTRRVRERETERHSASDIAVPETAGLADWFEEGAAALLDVLAAAEADTPIWNWSLGEQQASFWWRRMAQETAVHRWDAQSTYGRQEPIDPDLAVDGVDEFLTVFLPTDLVDRPDYDLGGTIELRCTDRPAAWQIVVTGGQLRVREDGASGTAEPPQAIVAGRASDLLLSLWRRVEWSAPEIEVSRDEALVARFYALADLD
jgi:uncharacterized protein (TIGR03083 family)